MLKKSYYIFSLLFLLQFPCIANDNSTTTKITVKKNYHTYTFLDENENVIFTRKLKRFFGFTEGYAAVVLDDWDFAIMNEKGDISDLRFNDLGFRFSEGKNFAMFKDNSTGVIDTNGNLLFKINVEFNEGGALAATNFSNGRAFVKESRKTGEVWYLIDDKGNKLKEFNNISGLGYFSCGLLTVQVKDGTSWKSNYMDSNGNLISKNNFDEIKSFENNIAHVRIGNENFYIDTNGNKISGEYIKYLKNFFEDENFRIRKISIADRTMYFARKNNESIKKPSLIEKAVIYEIFENGDIIPHIEFSENKIIADNSVLFSSYIKGKKFSGWSITIREENNSIHTDYYAENGTNVADGISIYWDNKDKIFKKAEIDQSQL